MADTLTKMQRGYVMSRIRSSNTQPELELKSVLRSFGFQYQPKGIYGKPDFADKKAKIAIFVDGCFWHKCPKHYRLPRSNMNYWKLKIDRNAKRRQKVCKRLRAEGWTVITVWEHEIKANKKVVVDKIRGIVDDN